EPANFTALVNRGNARVKSKRFEEGLGDFDKALAIEPDHLLALTDRGVVLAELDRLDEALVMHDQALRIDPNIFAANVNRGSALLKLNRLDEALDYYAKALAIEPDSADANFNAGITSLCRGDLRNGWPKYEYRWKRKPLSDLRPNFPQPQWRGEEDLQGKTIFLMGEQGLGDTIHFVRYAPMVAALGAKVILGVQRPLKSIAVTVPDVSC